MHLNNEPYVVIDYARRLAEACRLPYEPLLRKTGYSLQKNFENNEHKFANAYNVFEVNYRREMPENVILIDDVVDSGLTLAMCGMRLREKGCRQIFPFALADAKPEQSDGEDDE